MQTMLQHMCSKLDVHDPAIGIPDILSPVPPSEHGDVLSLYDNFGGLSTGLSVHGGRDRQRSIREPTDRPKSVHI